MTISRKHFKPSLIGTLLAIVLSTFLLSLGFWQLHRAEEKQQLLLLASQQQAKSPSVWREGMASPELYQRLILRGHYLPYTLLLDNQHFEHQWGYHVMNPFEVGDGVVVLVDRGWVAGDIRRMILPSVTVPDGMMQILGQAYYPSAKGFILGEAYEPHGASLGVIERVDAELISNLLHKKVYPFIIRLDKLAPAGYVRDWPIVTLSPQRHYGYALQWFAMALVLLIIYVSLSLKNR